MHLTSYVRSTLRNTFQRETLAIGDYARLNLLNGS